MIFEELGARNQGRHFVELQYASAMQIGNRVAQGARKGDRVIRGRAALPRYRPAGDFLTHENSVESFPAARLRATMSGSMTPASARIALAEAVLKFNESPETIQRRVSSIHTLLQQFSSYIREPNYTLIHPEDLQLLFGMYDREF